jgi:hypothetical protein
MKSEFVSTVSHELRTPLTSIRGSLGLISGGVAGQLPEAVKTLVGIAKSNCERLIRLINDILDIEKIESGKMTLDLQVVELKPLLEQALAANEGYGAAKNVSLQPAVPRRRGTAGQGRQRPPHAGGDQPAVQRDEVLARRRYVVDIHVARSEAGRCASRCATAGPAFRKSSATASSRSSPRPTPPTRARKAAPAWASTFHGPSSSAWAAASALTPAPGVGTTFFFELPEWVEPPVPLPVSWK